LDREQGAGSREQGTGNREQGIEIDVGWAVLTKTIVSFSMAMMHCPPEDYYSYFPKFHLKCHVPFAQRPSVGLCPNRKT